jgi:hypothetical protein
LRLARALNAIAPGFAGGAVDPEIYAGVQRQLTTRLQASLAELPHDDFNVVWSLTGALRCALAGASHEDAETMWAALGRVLSAEPATPLAGPITAALRERPPPAAQMRRIVRVLEVHPWCGVRTAALSLRQAAMGGDASRAERVEAARAAADSPCWRLQAAGLRALRQLEVSPDGGTNLPSFLRGAPGEPSRGRTGVR